MVIYIKHEKIKEMLQDAVERMNIKEFLRIKKIQELNDKNVDRNN